MNIKIKKILFDSIYFPIFILLIIGLSNFNFDKLNFAKRNFIINKGYKLENPKKSFIEEMDLIYDNLSENQVLISQGFVVPSDFITYLRIRNNLYKTEKRVILENQFKQQKLINAWDKSQRVSIILSCRYTNCIRDNLELKNLLINYKEKSLVKVKKVDYLCEPKKVIQNKLKNFGFYDCLPINNLINYKKINSK